jgi:hypothetical protein
MGYYTHTNFKSKAALKRALAAGEQIGIYQPGGLFNRDPGQITGRVTLEGPHYPEPHRWYAEAMVEAGVIKRLLN